MTSRGINKVILIGYLGQEPEIRYMPNGNPVTNITIATTETWNNKQTGESQEKTEWHRVVLFGKIAEIVKEYLHKGSQVYIEGFLQTRKWLDKNGQNKYITEIIVSVNGVMQMLGNRQINNNIVSENIYDNKKKNWWDNKSNQNKNSGVKNKNIDVNTGNEESFTQISDINNNDESITEFNDDIPF